MTSTARARRVLVPAARSAPASPGARSAPASPGARIRRYRLARMRLAAARREAADAGPHAHLRRAYD